MKNCDANIEVVHRKVPPEAARCADINGSLPINLAIASVRRSREFFRLLVEAYPGSVSILASPSSMFERLCGRNRIFVYCLSGIYLTCWSSKAAFGFPITQS